MSEFYELRRLAIKDVTAFCGFLIGFLGSAPFAWRYLSVQLEAGGFVRGLWYFFAVVAVAAVVAGIFGLIAGFVIGWVWERYHRHMRGLRASATSSRKARPDVEGAAGHGHDGFSGISTEPVRLHLVGPASQYLPELAQRRLTSVRFSASGVEFDFNGTIVPAAGNPAVVCGDDRLSYPDLESRDALCGLIGGTVSSVSTTDGNEIEVFFDATARRLSLPLWTRTRRR